MSTLDPSLIALARSQHGMLTTSQLMAGGVSAPRRVALVKEGVLKHPGRGLYAVTEQSSTEPVQWHRQLVAGAFLLYPDAMLTSVSALLANDIPVWNTPFDKPAILRDRDRSGGMKAFHIRRVLNRREGVDSPWGPCVPLADALVQHAIDTGIVQGVVSLDAALHQGLVREEDVEAAVARVVSWPKASRAKAMLELADGRRESVGESRTGVTLTFLGFEVVPQVRIWNENGKLVARVDFLIKGTRVIIEFDGKIKYRKKSETGEEDEDEKRALFEEKLREDALRELGYEVVRLVWSDLSRPHVIAAKIRRALARSRSAVWPAS